MRNVENLREAMKRNNINYYIIPSSDPHQSEYVSEHYRGRAYISGFTGSAGTLLVGENEAKLWTDGRYFIQAQEELNQSGIDLMKMATAGVDTLPMWIKKNVKSGETVGFDGRCYSINQYKELLEIANENKFNIDMAHDLLEDVWQERPELPKGEVFIHDIKYCGMMAKDKIEDVRQAIEMMNGDAMLISSLDDIAWLFNIRGNDILFNPVVLSYAIITKNSAQLYIDKSKVSDEVRELLLMEGIEVHDYNHIEEAVAQLKGKVILDPSKVNARLYALINCEIIFKSNITTDLKAIKNEVEIMNLGKCQVRDGVAMVKFIKWLKENVGKEKITEISASEKLSQLRAEGELSKGDSFKTIAGYKEHAAMMHYSASEESDYELKAEGLFLVDSGGQYLDGTTDITRTFVLGKLTEEEKKDYTLVLKGHINLARAKFLKGTHGENLDILARGPLWKHGLDYKCGTGHGVGFFLNVHEGPQGLRQSGNKVPLELGMVITNEPGVYKEGKHGIRIENTLLVVKDELNENGQFYRFNTISYCPIDLNGVNVKMLNKEERLWLNRYHRNVYERLSPYLNKEEKEFLKYETREI